MSSLKLETKYKIKNPNGEIFYGTPEEIVFDMRCWDTVAGRVSTNLEYMDLVCDSYMGRIKPTKKCNEFLQELIQIKELTVESPN